MIGTKLLHYHITAKLGDGGMGDVYLATDTRLERPVALKILAPSLTNDGDARARLLREARSASRLNHPNIITIHAAEETDDTVFLVTEFVEGQTLRERLGAVPHTELCDLILQVLDAMVEAHASGIVHRDIKPENVMVDERGRARVMDFGVAHDLVRQSGVTAPGTIAGTAFYMSPEQAQGTDIDARSDIFALGVLIYEMFTGSRPFDGQYYPAVMYDILHTDPPAMTDFDPGIPIGLESLVTKCLKKNRTERFQTAAELAAEFRALSTQYALANPTTMAKRDTHANRAQPQPTVSTVRSGLVEAIVDDIARGANQRGLAVILTGESGIGKSRVAEDVCERLDRRNTTQLRARCLPQSGGLPYHVFFTAIQHVLPGWDSALVAQFLERGRMAGVDYSNRLPILRAFLDPTSPTRASLNREQVWDAILAFFRIISSDRPVLLFIDDLQWADNDTVGLFAYLARNVTSMPLILLATRRQEEWSDVPGTDFVEATLKQLRIENAATFHELSRLTDDDTRRIILTCLNATDVDSTLARLVSERAAGNPLFIKELIAYLNDQDELEERDGCWRLRHDSIRLPLPQRIQDLITQRVEHLTADDRIILEYAACETEYFDSHVLCTCLGTERIHLLRRLQQFENRLHLIRHDRARYRFDHPMIREVLYDGILPELREEYHRQIAGVLSKNSGDNPHDWPRIAHHLLASNQPREALPFLLGAADRARTVHANNEAIRLYREAETIHNGLTAPDASMTLRLVAGIGDVLLALGQIVDAMSYYERGVSLAEDLDDVQWVVGLLEKEAVALRFNGQLDRAVDTARRAEQLATTHDDPQRHASCLNTLAFIHAAMAEYDTTIQLSRRALDSLGHEPDEQLESIALSHMGHAHFHRGEFREAVDVLARAIVEQRSIGDTRGLAQALNFAGLAYHRLGEFSQSLASHEESLSIKRSLNDLAVIPGGLNALGDAYRDMGLMAEAIAHHNESLALAREHGNVGSECDSLRDLGADYLIQGDLDKAAEYLHAVYELASNNGYAWYETLSKISLAELAVARGDEAAAERLSTEAMTLASERSARELIIKSLQARSMSLRQRGLIDEAIASMKQAIDTATEAQLESILWRLIWQLGELFHESGNSESAQLSFDSARKCLSKIVNQITDPDLRARVEAVPEVRELLVLR